MESATTDSGAIGIVSDARYELVFDTVVPGGSVSRTPTSLACGKSFGRRTG